MGVSGQTPPDTSTNTPQKAAGRCTSGAQRQRKASSPPGHHEDDEREMEDEDQIGQGVIDHDACLLGVGSSVSGRPTNRALSAAAQTADGR